MTGEECGRIINMLRGQYSNFHPDPEVAIEGWMILLEPIPYEAVKQVLPALLAKHTEFAPSPAAIRAAVVETAHATSGAEEGWELVLKGIRQRGTWNGPDPEWPPLVMKAVNALGWEYLCATEIKDMSYQRDSFVKFYTAFRDRELADAQHMLGTGMKEIAG